MNSKFVLTVAAVFVAAGISVVQGQQSAMSVDEKAIRDLIANTDSGKPAELTANMVLFHHRLEAPFYRGEGNPGRFKASAPETIPSASRRTSTIRRLEISKSGDMAYVVDEGVNTSQLKNGKSETVSTAALRVFKKENGRWLAAAVFTFPSTSEAKK